MPESLHVCTVRQLTDSRQKFCATRPSFSDGCHRRQLENAAALVSSRLQPWKPAPLAWRLALVAFCSSPRAPEHLPATPAAPPLRPTNAELIPELLSLADAPSPLLLKHPQHLPVPFEPEPSKTEPPRSNPSQTKPARTLSPFPDLPRHKLLHTSRVPFCSFAGPLRHYPEPPAKSPFVQKTLNVDNLAQPSSSPTCCAVSLLHAPCCSPARWFAFSCTVAPLSRRPEAADAMDGRPSSLLPSGPIP